MRASGLCAIALLVAVSAGAVHAAPISIELTSDGLGLGSAKINHAGNGSAVEADRIGQLITSTQPNAGSALTIQTDGNAGPGDLVNPLLVTVTAGSHLDVQTNLPAGYDFHGGVISLTNNAGDLSKEGLGVRSFGIDLAAGPNYGKRYVNPAFVAGNVHGYQMEGSKEVSGGVNDPDWLNFVVGQPTVPGNMPPHVDENVTFDFNDAEVAALANNVVFVLTNIKAGSQAMDLAVDLTIKLVGGAPQFMTFEYASNDTGIFSVHPSYSNVLLLDLGSASLGFGPTDILDSVVIGARDDPADDPKGTDEHFLINGFTVGDYTIIAEPATLCLLVCGGAALLRRRRRALAA